LKIRSVDGKAWWVRAGFAVSAGVAFAACGPDLSAVRNYVAASSRRDIAVMPFTVGAGQKNVVPLVENEFRSRLVDLGFKVAARPGAGRGGRGARSAPFQATDAQEFGRRSGASVVLTGRILRATGAKSGKPAVVRERKRWVTDATGKRVRVVEQVETRVERPEIPAGFALTVRLVDTATGADLWNLDASDDIPGWSLEETARYRTRQMAESLARSYLNQNR
jgi:hypothetical protein